MKSRGGERETLRVLALLAFAPRFDAPHGGRATAELLLRLSRVQSLGIVCLRQPGEGPTAEELRQGAAFVEEIELPLRSSTSLARLTRRLALFASLVRGSPMQVFDWASDEARDRLRAAIAAFQPDIVHVEPRAMAQYLIGLERSAAARVLVEHEPVVATARELYKHYHGFEKAVRSLDLNAWKRFEVVSTREVDAIVALTERDKRTIQRVKGPPVFVVPLGVEIPPERLSPLGIAPPTVLYVGGFGHPPNVDAALRLARWIMPSVRARVPSAVLYLVGERPPKQLLELSSESVVVTGRVDDVRPFLDRAAVVVAPLRLGGGMRNKVLEALGAGKAIVASPLAAAGLEVTDGEQLLIAESDEEVAAAVVRLLEEPARRAELADAARAWAELHLDWSGPVDGFEALYRSLARSIR